MIRILDMMKLMEFNKNILLFIHFSEGREHMFQRFAASIAIKLEVSLVSLTFVIVQVLLQTKDLVTLVTLNVVTFTHVI